MNNIWVTWGDVFNSSLQNLWWSLAEFTPRLIVAIVLFIVGWVLGSLVAKAFEHVFRALKVDRLFQSIGGDDFLRRAGMNLDTGYFVGQVVKWFIIIVFLLPSLNLVGLGEISLFLRDDVLGFLPRVIIAAMVLVIATVVSEALQSAVVAGARTINLRSANLLGALAKYAVWVFAFVIVLGKLGLEEYMSILFSGLVAMIALGGALAFGLGGKDHASRLISRLSEEVSHRG